MVTHNQTIRRQQLTNCLSVFGHFMGLALKRVNLVLWIFYIRLRTIPSPFERQLVKELRTPERATAES